LRMSLVDCTFFWLLLAKLTDVTLPPVILATSCVTAYSADAAARSLQGLCAALCWLRHTPANS
jgi:hypothetical protein